jgi:hypothetical protein
MDIYIVWPDHQCFSMFCPLVRLRCLAGSLQNLMLYCISNCISIPTLGIPIDLANGNGTTINDGRLMATISGVLLQGSMAMDQWQ